MCDDDNDVDDNDRGICSAWDYILLLQMQQYGQTPEDPTYTALFNACSNSPWPEDGLRRASELRELMATEDYQPNMMTYNAMIKVYARFGDIKSAFAVVDEALDAGHYPTATTYSCLLMACISDKSAGFKLAIEVCHFLFCLNTV